MAISRRVRTRLHGGLRRTFPALLSRSGGSSVGRSAGRGTCERGGTGKRLLAAAAAGALALTPTPASAALGTGVTAETIFSNPYDATSGYDYRIQERQIKLMDAAPVGATIRFTAWRLTYKRFADAVIRAQNRGVNVYGVANGDNRGGTQFERVRVALGPNFTVCKTDHPTSTYDINSCLSTRAASFMHSKLLLISNTGTKHSVVVTTTANPTNHGNEANDAIVWAGDTPMYDAYVRYFEDMRAMRKNNNYMMSANGQFPPTGVPSAGSSTITQFTPRSDSKGGTSNEFATDNVALALSKKSAGADATAKANCKVLAHHRYWDATRSVVTDQVIRLKQEGCADVRVLTDDLSATEEGRMEAVGIRVRRTLRTNAAGVRVKTHHKYFVLKGAYDGVADNDQLLTGSQNLVRSSLRTADDYMVQASHDAIIHAYAANFEAVWAKAYS